MCCCWVAVDRWLAVAVAGRRAELLAGLAVGLFCRAAVRLLRQGAKGLGLVLPWVGLGD